MSKSRAGREDFAVKSQFSSLWQLTTGLDRLVLMACAAVAAGSFVIPFTSPVGNEICVEMDRQVILTGALYQVDRFEVAGKLGPVLIETGKKGVRVVRSDCPQQICMAQGWRKRQGETIVCVPNHLVITITGGERGGRDVFDAITR